MTRLDSLCFRKSGFPVRSSLFITPLHNAHNIKYHSHNLSLQCIPAQHFNNTNQPNRELQHDWNPGNYTTTQLKPWNPEAAENPCWRTGVDLFGLVNAQIITPNWVEVFYKRCKTTHKHIKEQLLKNACAYFS